MHLDRNTNEDDYVITDDKDKIIKPKKVMKVLGVKINKDNNLRAHLCYLNSKITMTFNPIKDAIPHMTSDTRKVIINSKLRGQITMFLPLLINQNQAVRRQAEVLLMRVNKLIYGQNYFLTSNENICKKINIPSPEEEIVKACAKDIQKTMFNQKTPSVLKLITRTKRNTANF